MNAILLSLILSAPIEWMIESKELPDGDEMQKITNKEFTGEFGKWRCAFNPINMETNDGGEVQVLSAFCITGESNKKKEPVNTYSFAIVSEPCANYPETSDNNAMLNKTFNGRVVFVLNTSSEQKKKPTEYHRTKITVGCIK